MASVINIYARAFADVVIANHLDVQKTLAEAQQIAGFAAENNILREVWEAPSIPAEQKRAVLDAIVRKTGTSKPVRNFVAVLIDKQRIRLLNEVVAQFAQELNLRLGLAEAEITTARELTTDERQEIERELGLATGKRIKAHYAQDRSILGGAIARVGSTVYDGSVKGQLERIRQQLVNA